MRLILAVILLAFPFLEAWLLVRLGESLGWWILAWVMLAALAGAALIKEARFALIARLTAGLAQGHFAVGALTDSARTVVAGLFLIFPGVVSDLVAFTLLLLPGPRMAAMPEAAARRSVGGTLIEGEFRRTR